MNKKIHFIAIGGSAMHNLAIALHLKGCEISGSDDEVFEPSKSRLAKHNILPKKIGWDISKINPDLSAIILGMHAREDNPELLKAKELGLQIFSYPEYLYQQTKSKQRIVIGGSHGKTTITSMLLHALHSLNEQPDYMVGALLEGFDCMVKLNEEAEFAVLEGDEYLSSPIDRRPKFHLYKPHIAVLTGIAWDHINVFPTFEFYVDQFRIFIKTIEKGGTLYYFEGDEELVKLAKEKPNPDIDYISYNTLPHAISAGKTSLKDEEGKNYELEIFGNHNLQNLAVAVKILKQLGKTESEIYEAFISFKGASKRLEKVFENEETVFYKDFAHAPSKLKASTTAFSNQYPARKLIACLELHTFSSLNKDFLPEYANAMDTPSEALVYFSPEVLKHKKLAPISVEEVKQAFNRKDLKVFTDSGKMLEWLKEQQWQNTNLLMMSSGNFDGVNFETLAEELF